MDEIAKLLENAQTPTERATLLVLYKIQQNLTSINKEFVEHRVEFAEHRTAFTNHVTDEQKLLNKGIGGWMVMSVFLATALSVSGWYISHHIIDLNTAQQITIDINTNRITALETLIRDYQDNHSSDSRGNGIRLTK